MKKGELDIVEIFLLGIIVLTFVFGLKSIYMQEHPEKYLNRCQITCQKMGYKYVKLNRGGFFVEDSCWGADKNNEPKRLW